MKSKLTLAALAIAAAVTLACGAGGQDNRDGTAQIEQASPGGTEAGGGDKQPQGALPMDGKTAQKYRDGFRVLLSAPKKYKVPAHAAGHTAGNSAITFKVTFVNDGGEQVDLALADVNVSVGGDGAAADRIFAEGLDDITGVVAPGRRKTFDVAFSAPTKDLSVVDVTVTPGVLDYADAVFTGKVG